MVLTITACTFEPILQEKKFNKNIKFFSQMTPFKMTTPIVFSKHIYCKTVQYNF